MSKIRWTDGSKWIFKYILEKNLVKCELHNLIAKYTKCSLSNSFTFSVHLSIFHLKLGAGRTNVQETEFLKNFLPYPVSRKVNTVTSTF